MTDGVRTAIIDQFMENSETMIQEMRMDLIREMHDRILQRNLIETETTRAIIIDVLTAVTVVDIGVDMWHSAFRASEYVSNWYEN